MKITSQIKPKIGYLAILVIWVTNILILPQNIQAQKLTNNSPEISDENQNQEDISDFNDQIDQRKKELEELNEKAEVYRKNIEIKQTEALTLQNELSLLDDYIAKTSLDLQKTQTEINKLDLEIKNLKSKIEAKEKEIKKDKKKLAELIRVVYRNDQKTYLEITLANDSFSDFYNQIKYLEAIQVKIKDSLGELKNLKTELEAQKQESETKKKEQEDQKLTLETNQNKLQEQQGYKGGLLFETRESESKFQDLVNEIREEQQQINAEITSLEIEARRRLEGEDGDFEELGDAVLSWPVDPSRGITAYFHDPDYIFRQYFEHPGIDVRASQGTPIAAAADGYIAIAKQAGLGYSYVMIVHKDNISTVYGHLSAIKVTVDSFVKRGQIIGLSGGTPGTTGAGRLTTGPHLHFEVRLNGIPVNPLDYLP